MFSSRALPAALRATSRSPSAPPSASRSRRAPAVITAKKTSRAKAKSKDSGRSIHFRTGPERFNAGGVGEAPRGGKGSGKTTRAQRTNKVYKRYLTGRPTVDDVERASRGDRTKAMGVVEREAPYRLNRADREAWERAKRRGGHGHGDGTGGGGFLEIQTKQTNALAPHRHPLVNTHRLYCDAKTAPFVLVEQDRDAGRDEIVVDLSTLRVERDGAIRARLLELADEIGRRSAVGGVSGVLSARDECEDLGEPLDAQTRYVRGLQSDIALDAIDDAEPDAPGGSRRADASGVGPSSSPPPTADEIAAATAAVEEAAGVVRALKDAGATNADDAVMAGVATLLERKARLAALDAAVSAATPEAKEAALKAEREALERAEEEARRTIAELPIHALPERYLRFACADRPTAKTLAKALAEEPVMALLLDDEASDDAEDASTNADDAASESRVRVAIEL